MTAGESKETQGLQKRENWDSSILTAGESNNPKDHRREDWDQPNEDRKWNRHGYHCNGNCQRFV